jgi:TonB family protein
MILRTLVPAVFFALVSLPVSAQQPTLQDVDPTAIQKRAADLMDKARKLSDIRAASAPAFRLTATFSFVDKDLETLQGTYTEVWVSKLRWRRETVVKNWRSIEVGGATGSWLLDNADDFPEPAARLPNVTGMFPPNSSDLVFASIDDHKETDPPIGCAVTAPDSLRVQSAYCFDAKIGVLLQRVSPQFRPGQLVAESCDYGSFQKTGDYWFPREMVCFEDRHRKLDAKVIDLSLNPTTDPAIFTPPPGAIEIDNCPVTPQPPRAISAPDPAGHFDHYHRVDLSLVVDKKGKPQHVRVIRSRGTPLDEAALRAVKAWQFLPGTCNGEPIALPIEVNVSFRP